MALIKDLNACHLLGINKSLNIFSFWFDEDVNYLYNRYKCLPKRDERKNTTQIKKCINKFKNFAKGILWFYDKIHDKKSEVPTELLEWKPSFKKISYGSVPKLMQRLIDNNMIKRQKDITMTFERDQIVQFFVTFYHCLMNM